MSGVQFREIEKWYGEMKVLNCINFEIKENQIICLVGPSGCGKSTILNLLSQSIVPDFGKIIDLKHKKISSIFQKPRLMPWLTVKENMEFVHEKTENKEAWISFWLSEVELIGFENYYPSQLSGGMEQRVSLARGFSVKSDLLLMDEPFKGLDEPLKWRMLDLVYRLWKKSHTGIVFVTHDIREALLLGNKIVILTEKPSNVAEEINISIPYEKRHIGCRQLIELEEYIYAKMDNPFFQNRKCRK